MALSCSRLCSQLSLIRLCGPGTYRISHGFHLPSISRQSRQVLCRHYRSSEVRRGLGRYVVSKLQWANTKYEDFLRRRFPRFFQLYQTFLKGFKVLFQDANEVGRIRAKMSYYNMEVQDLPYRDLEKLREYRRNLIKAIPSVILSIPPFANYIVIAIMYYFPRQLLIPLFWTPKQHVEFWGVYHTLRAQHHLPVLKGVERISHQNSNDPLLSRLKELCAKVQNGENPEVSEILAVRSLFDGPPLGIRTMNANHMRHISRLLFLTPRLPGFLIYRRLKSHAVELLLLDRALSKLGPHQLSDSELRQACYLRGINSYSLDVDQCREWLSQWLQMSSSLKESEVSLLLHCIVFLSANYPNPPNRHNQEA